MDTAEKFQTYLKSAIQSFEAEVVAERDRKHNEYLLKHEEEKRKDCEIKRHFDIRAATWFEETFFQEVKKAMIDNCSRVSYTCSDIRERDSFVIAAKERGLRTDHSKQEHLGFSEPGEGWVEGHATYSVNIWFR